MIHNIKADSLIDSAKLKYLIICIISIPKTPHFQKDFTNLSLEEIEKIYGKEDDRMVYSYAARGLGDMTIPKVISPDPLPKLRLFDIEIILKSYIYPHECWVFLYPNKYSQSKQKRIIIFKNCK